jgi:hypothetical protein
MMLLYVIAAIVLAFVIRTTFVFARFRKLASEQKHQVGRYLSDGLSLTAAVERVLSDLNQERNLGLTQAAISTVSQRIAALSSIMDTSNIVDILAQFTQRHILLETRSNFFRKPPSALDNNRVLFAAEHLDLQHRNGYFLLKPSTQADFKTKYPD